MVARQLVGKYGLFIDRLINVYNSKFRAKLYSSYDVLKFSQRLSDVYPFATYTLHYTLYFFYVTLAIRTLYVLKTL